MDIGVAPEDMTPYGFIPRCLSNSNDNEHQHGGTKQQHIELLKRIRARHLARDTVPYIRYNRDFEHETRVAVSSESLEYVSNFELLRDDDGFVEWVCIPPGICVACTNNLCWFHEPGASKTYNDLMYELGDAMDKGTCTMENFMNQLETFFHIKELDVGPRATPQGYYPHKFLGSIRQLQSAFNFVHRILVRSPKGLIRYLVENELIPSKTELEHHADEIIRIACGNPDPNASVLQYLVEDVKLVKFEPNNNLLGIARTEQTIRFLLRQGLNCKGIKLHPIGDYSEERAIISHNHVEPQFVLYPIPPRQKAGILRALFEYGTDYPLFRWAFIDLESFRVIETFCPHEQIVQWIENSRHDICMDREFYLDVWPYLCKNYGFQFTAEEFICALLVNNGPGDWEYDDFTSADFVLTYHYVRNKCHLQAKHIGWFFQRLATLINYNRTVVPFPIAINLSILDKYLIWNPYTFSYFSRALKKRLFTLFCVFRRYSGSTLALKPLLPMIVPRIVSEAPYEKEEEQESTCHVQ